VSSLRFGEVALASAAYAAVTVWWLWPLATAASTHYPHFHAEVSASVADFFLIVWALTWDTHALLTAPLSLFHANTFYPSTLPLAYSEHFLGYVPLFGPVYVATHNPILAANVLILFTYPLCAVAMYCLARRWVVPPAAAAAGFFYAFYPWRYLDLAHFHMLGVQYFPLSVLFTERWLDGRRKSDLAWLTLALVLQVLSSFYLAYALLVMYAPYVVLALCRRWRRLDWQRIAGLAVAGGTATAVLLLVSLPYLTLRSLGVIPYSASGIPFGLLPLFSAHAVGTYLREQGVGWVGYGLALLAVLPMGNRRWPALLGVVVALAGTVAALGTGIPIPGHVLWSPYKLLVDWVPGFSTVREPIRFVLVAQLGFALLAGLGCARLVELLPARLAWPATASLLLMSLAVRAHLPAVPLHRELTGSSVPPAYRWLAKKGDGRALLELPRGDFAGAARRMYLSTYHWLPIVEGYSGYPPPTAHYLYFLASGLPRRPALQELVDVIDLGWILVHGDQFDDPDRLEEWYARFLPGLEPIGAWGDDLLFRVTLPVANDRRASFLSASVTREGAALAPLAACPGEIVWTEAPPELVRPLRRIMARIKITNSGSETWPVSAFYPRHTVRLAAGVVNTSGSIVRVAEEMLPRDVGPGESISVVLPVKTPRKSGRYSLEVTLLQVGDGPLARCGVAPLSAPVRVARVSEVGP
jgi:hypothetical protein